MRRSKIAVDVAWAVQNSATIDWSLRESVRAAMRSKIRRLLAKYDYPPDREEKAIELVLSKYTDQAVIQNSRSKVATSQPLKFAKVPTILLFTTFTTRRSDG